MLNFTVLGNPPSKANRYRRGRNCFYKDQSVVNYEQSFAWQTVKVPKYTFQKEDKIGIRIEWYYPHLKSDLDGILKIILDCMTKNNIIVDDRYIYALWVYRKGLDKLRPRVSISVWRQREEV